VAEARLSRRTILTLEWEGLLILAVLAVVVQLTAVAAAHLPIRVLVVEGLHREMLLGLRPSTPRGEVVRAVIWKPLFLLPRVATPTPLEQAAQEVLL
jgi:hypothetical protein